MFLVTTVKLGQQLNYTNQLLKETIVECGDGVFGQLQFPLSEMFVSSAEQVKRLFVCFDEYKDINADFIS